MNRTIRIEETYVVCEEGRTQDSVLGPIPRSYCIIKYSEISGDHRYHYAHAIGGQIPHAVDILPGGSLYLGDTFEAAIRALGIQGKVEGGPCP